MAGFDIDDAFDAEYEDILVYIYLTAESTYDYGAALVEAGFVDLEDGHYLNPVTDEYVIIILDYIESHCIIVLDIFVD